MKLVFVAALVVMTVGGISAAVIPDSQVLSGVVFVVARVYVVVAFLAIL